LLLLIGFVVPYWITETMWVCHYRKWWSEDWWKQGSYQ